MLQQRAHEIAPIPGATEFLESVRAAGWQIGIITGAWSDSARLKLRAANFPELLLVSCDVFISRPEIVRCAISQFAPMPAVLFGDGTWDYAAAREAGIGFIGIGSGEPAARLRAAGARDVFPDYRDCDLIFQAMQQRWPERV